MDSDERDIRNYLKSFAGQFVSYREIGRRVCGRRRFERDPDWHLPVLTRLMDAGIIECDGAGHYRLPVPPPSSKKPRTWVAPQLRKILERSGKFDELLEIHEDAEASEP